MKKRILSIVLILCMVLSFVPTTAFAAQGITPSTPQKDTDGVYQIGTAEELYGFAQLVNSKTEPSANAVLTTDIVVNTGVLKADGTLNSGTFTSWTPIGKIVIDDQSGSIIEDFCYYGTFDGQGHTISGLYFNNTNTERVGLFGCLGSGGEIKNVGVIDSYFNGYNSVGGVCGRNYGTITGCYNAGAVRSVRYYIGGVCGLNYGTITGCYNTGKVSGTRDYVGGVCGWNNGGITGCYNTGTVSGVSSVGGVCGFNKSTITGCYNTGTVSGVSSVGGVCGFNKSTITGCYNTGTVSGNSYVGGVCGGSDGTVTDCDVKTDAEFENGTVCKLLNTALKNANSSVRFYQGVKSPEFIHAPQLVDGVYQIGTVAELYWFAGLVNGTLTDGTEQNASANAVLTADIVVNTGVLKADGNLADDTSGFTSWTPIGYWSSTDYVYYSGKFDGQGHTISGLYFNDPSTDYVGLFGYLSGGEIKNVGVIDSYFNGHDFVGGVCGWNNGTITGCYNTGTVSGGSYVGGVCGFNNGTITGCYSTGTVSGTSHIGGVCGANFVTITGCYNIGTVSGSSSVGGVCGWNNGAITGCYNTGTVSGSGNYVGGVCGYNQGGTITGCYTNNKGICGVNNNGTVKDCEEYTGDEFKDGTVCKLLNTALQNANSDVRFYQGVKSPEFIHAPQLVDGVYQISSAAELYWFAQLVNSGVEPSANAVLTADIVVNTGVLNDSGALNTGTFTSWTPIGNASNTYTGKFDGQGHTISGLYCNISGDNVGLFGFLGTDGEIRNVGVIDSYFRGDYYVGGVCGNNFKGTITGCYNTGTVSGSYGAGGMCGQNEGTITGCYNTGTVSGSGEVGGVCGYNWNGEITGCYNTGTVIGYERVGGVCGDNYSNGTITGCYNTGTVSGKSNVGGVCGYNYGGTISSDCAEYNGNEFKDSTVCGLLNTALKNASSKVLFCQTIGTDASPLLSYQLEEHTPIYTVENNTFKLACVCGEETKKTMELTLTSEKTVVANGAENTLTATLSNYENETVTYKWYQNGTLIQGATLSTYKMPADLPLGTYTYDVQVSMEGAGTITQSVSVFVDNDPPTGEISVGTKSWTDSPDNITFDSFFKDTQTVTINASDNSGKAVKIEYLVSHKELTAEELANATFTAYNNNTFIIDPDNEYVIYARLTDESGNVAYISSNGIVLDSVVPVISGIENGKTYCEKQTFTVTEKYLESVKVNGDEVTLDENNQFTLNPAEGTQEIVVTDKAGNVSDEMVVTVNNGHTDKNPKDHKCDICGENVGVHDDINKDHKCDYGCDEPIGEHKDDTKDHKCDYGCNEPIGEHKDDTKDHKCDYGCDEPIGEHKVADGKHTCDYCGEEMTTCKDENPIDHKCDICGATLTECKDENPIDHKCDICGATLTKCKDENPKDHKCDICGENVGAHEDNNKDHACDYGCAEVIGVHKDNDKDHKCDYGCAVAIGEHKVADGKHTCDYCGKEMTTCEDENPKDHKCDICGEDVGAHEDNNNDHKCDYGCAEVIGAHEDNDKDHACDYGCAEVIGEHKDDNNDHKCDYCGVKVSAHIGDVNDDGKVDIKDVTYIQKYLAGYESTPIDTSDEIQLKTADVNGDGKINISDATTIQMYLAGYFDKL